MNEYLIPLTSACTLVTLNYIAVKIRSKMLIEPYEHWIAPIFTGFACMIMMLQPLSSQLGLIDLRSIPVFMAGLRYGLPIALVSAVFPVLFGIFSEDPHWVTHSLQELIVPALLSSFFHNQALQSGQVEIRIRNGLKICLFMFAVRLLFSYYLQPAASWGFLTDQLYMLLLTTATLTLLIIMVNDENRTWMLQRQSELQANQDGLTRLPNMRSFQNIAGNMMRTRKFSIFMIDIDNFKKFNDQFGHLEGDRLLRNIASILRENIREQDYVARYGGEEFILMSTETDIVRLSQYAQQLCVSVVDQTLQEFKGAPLITISIGISMAKHPMDDLHRIIKEADIALYQSKYSGKNRYTLYSKELTG